MSNEILERAIRTVKNTLDKSQKTGIDPYLAMLSIRATPISDKIPSPAKLLLGRKLQINMPLYATPPPPDNHDISTQQLTQCKHSQEFYLDMHARTHPPPPYSWGSNYPITSTSERLGIIYRRYIGDI